MKWTNHGADDESEDFDPSLPRERPRRMPETEQHARLAVPVWSARGQSAMSTTERSRISFGRTYRIASTKVQDYRDATPSPLTALLALGLTLWWLSKGVPEADITWYEPRDLADIDVDYLKFLDPTLDELGPGGPEDEELDTVDGTSTDQN